MPSNLTRSDIYRKLIHMAVGSVLMWLIARQYLTAFHLFWVLAAMMVASFGLKAFFRSYHKRIVWLFEKHPKDAAGERVIVFLIGIILTLQLFPPDIALAAIGILTFGDGLSGLIGPFGHIHTLLSEEKLLEGTLAGIMAGALAAGLFVTPAEALLAATVAMTLEAMELKLNQSILDDNLVVPLAAGTSIVLARHFELAAFLGLG